MQSLQGIFDTVLAHLRRQGRPSYRKTLVGYHCSYRTEDGCSCAIGCLIPDNLYHPGLESHRVGWILRTQQDVATHLCNAGGGWTQDLLDLLIQLQSAHDDWAQRDAHRTAAEAPAVAWEGLMRTIAERFGLTYATPA